MKCWSVLYIIIPDYVQRIERDELVQTKDREIAEAEQQSRQQVSI